MNKTREALQKCQTIRLLFYNYSCYTIHLFFYNTNKYAYIFGTHNDRQRDILIHHLINCMKKQRIIRDGYLIGLGAKLWKTGVLISSDVNGSAIGTGEIKNTHTFIIAKITF